LVIILILRISGHFLRQLERMMNSEEWTRPFLSTSIYRVKTPPHRTWSWKACLQSGGL